MILKSYKDNKLQGLINLFGKDENGNVTVTKNKKVIKKLMTFCKRIRKICDLLKK